MMERFNSLGARVCDTGANFFGLPMSLLLIIIFSLGWIGVGWQENALTLVLSILAITLTQMVLNQQRRHEAALHTKIDELILAMTGARDEVAGIEGKSEAEIEALKRSRDAADTALKQRGADERPAE